MNNEEKILQILTRMQGDISGLKQDVSGLKKDVSGLKQGQAETNKRLDKLEQGQAGLEQKVTKIEVTIENETNRNIKLLVEGHKGIIEKPDGLPEKVVALQEESRLHHTAIHELSRRTANK